MSEKLRRYYEENPLMVSSPFGGVDGINSELLLNVFHDLDIDIQAKKILDVGCGRGFIEEFVVNSGGDYTGVDFVSSRQGFRLALADSAGLPFADNTFDALFCIDAFEHFPDAQKAVVEFHRVMKPDGLVFLSVPNYANIAGLVKKCCETFGRYEKNTWAPFRNWQPQELEHALTSGRVRRLFKKAGFNKLKRIGHGPEAGLGLFPWIEHAKMPEAIKFRLQRLFIAIGPAIAAVYPDASLHSFWKIEV